MHSVEWTLFAEQLWCRRAGPARKPGPVELLLVWCLVWEVLNLVKVRDVISAIKVVVYVDLRAASTTGKEMTHSVQISGSTFQLHLMVYTRRCRCCERSKREGNAVESSKRME